MSAATERIQEQIEKSLESTCANLKSVRDGDGDVTAASWKYADTISKYWQGEIALQLARIADSLEKK